jgi:hypothetical protein
MNKLPRYFAKGIGLAAFGAVLGFVGGSWFIAGQFIASDPSPVSWPKQFSDAPKEVTFKASDGINLKGWFLTQTNSSSAVVLLHGVAANRYQMLDRALWLHSLGYNVLPLRFARLR